MRRAAASYSSDAVESVDGREVEVEAEEVKGQDAEHVHLKELGASLVTVTHTFDSRLLLSGTKQDLRFSLKHLYCKNG